MWGVMEKGARRGRGRSTIADVARLAGVSPMTVSRVVNDGANVRAATRERVAAAISELNYAPNAAARTLASAESLRLGLLYGNPSASWLSALLVGALDGATRIGAQLVIERYEPDPGGIAEAVARMIKDAVDGVLLPAPLGDSAEAVNALSEAGIVTVSIASGRTLEGRRSVAVDNCAAAHAIVGHLLDLGHRAIGFVGGPPNQAESADRLRGYREALAAARITPEPHWVQPGSFTYRSGLDAGLALLCDPKPTAIFAGNDDMAAGVCAAAHRRGLDVPDDLSVVGFDDTEMAAALWPALTTIRQPTGEMGRVAVDMLADAIRGTPAGLRDLRRTLPFDLVRRESARPIA